MILLLARVAQGIGGGGLAPSEQAILTDTFPPAKRGAAFALYGVAVVVAPAIGPALGGWITDSYSWRWIFFLNIPVGLLSLFLTYHFVPEEEKSGTDKQGKRIDYLGFGLVATGLGCLQVVLDRGQIDDWFGSPMITVFAVIAAVALLVGLVHELTTKDPIVALPLMRNTSFFVSNVVMFFVGVVLFATTQLIPQLTQDLFGYDATNAGLTLSPGRAGRVRPDARRRVPGQPGAAEVPDHVRVLHHRLRPVVLDQPGPAASFRELVFCRLIQAGGLAFLFVPINTIAYSGLPKGASNDASALINLMRNYGGSVGVSIVQTMVSPAAASSTRPGSSRRITDVNPVYHQQVHGPMHRSIGAIYAERRCPGRDAVVPGHLQGPRDPVVLRHLRRRLPQTDETRRGRRGRALTPAGRARHRCRAASGPGPGRPGSSCTPAAVRPADASPAGRPCSEARPSPGRVRRAAV